LRSRTDHAPAWLGIDIGGSSIKAGIVRADGVVLDKLRLPLPLPVDRGPEVALAAVCAAAERLLEQVRLPVDDLAVIGVAAPGTLNLDAGVILHPFNLPGWENLPIVEFVHQRFGIPTVLLNDANAAGYGEYWAGEYGGGGSLLLWTLGTGIGSGIVINGEIWEGAHAHAGECGHMIVQMDGGLPSPHGVHGALELYAGARGLVRRCELALEAGRDSLLGDWLRSGRNLSPVEITQAAELGDPLATELILESARYLGIGTVNVMHVLNPESILFGGAMTFGGPGSTMGEQFLASVRETVKSMAFPIPASRTRIEFATLGNDAGFIGAAAHAARCVGQLPLRHGRSYQRTTH
jgi:glucokinase